MSQKEIDAINAYLDKISGKIDDVNITIGKLFTARELQGLEIENIKIAHEEIKSKVEEITKEKKSDMRLVVGYVFAIVMFFIGRLLA